MKFYERAEFKQLNAKWRKKLSRSFSDIEDDQENLKNKDLRTQAWEQRDQILEFFLALDEFLNQTELPIKHRRTLELYSEGVFLKEISVKVNMSYSWVRMIINRYEAIILDQD